MPDKPILPTVKFKQANGGVFLDNDNARILAEREIINRAYIEKLENRIEINNREAVGGTSMQ